MKAAVYEQYGGPEVLSLAEVNKPIPKPNEVLVKIHATTVTSGDVRLRASDFPPLFWLPARIIFGLFKPKKKILGHEFAGVVESIGANVTEYKVGDEVFGTTTLLKNGSYAEYVCIPKEWKHGVIALKPGNLTFEQAAALPIGGMTALFLLKKAKLVEQLNILVYGASGSVGSYAIQLARAYNCKVTGVSSAKNLDAVKELGAQQVIDYTLTDYSTIEDPFDIVFDAVGKTNKSKAKKILKPGGKYVSVNMMTEEKRQDLLEIKELAEKGQIKPLIDQVMPLDEIVKAHAYVDTGRKKGNLIIKIAD